MNQELQNYINEERKHGASDEVIKQRLRDNGWQDDMFLDYFFTDTSSQQKTYLQEHTEKTKNHNTLIFIILGVIIVLAGGVYFAYAQGYFNFNEDNASQEEVMMNNDNNDVVEENSMVVEEEENNTEEIDRIHIISELDLGYVENLEGYYKKEGYDLERLDECFDEEVGFSINAEFADKYYNNGQFIDLSDYDIYMDNTETIIVDGEEISFELIEFHNQDPEIYKTLCMYYEDEEWCEDEYSWAILIINGYETTVAMEEAKHFTFDNGLEMSFAFMDDDIDFAVIVTGDDKDCVSMENKKEENNNIDKEINFDSLNNGSDISASCQMKYNNIVKIYESFDNDNCEELFGSDLCYSVRKDSDNNVVRDLDNNPIVDKINQEELEKLKRTNIAINFNNLDFCAYDTIKYSKINICSILYTDKYLELFPLEYRDYFDEFKRDCDGAIDEFIEGLAYCMQSYDKYAIDTCIESLEY